MTQIKTERILSNPAIGIDHAGEGELLISDARHWRQSHQLDASGRSLRAPLPHTVAWDARGYGLSDDYDGPLDFNAFSRDLLKVLDHFGVEKAHICGLSMGGRIAQDFYLHYPERVKTLALVATFSGFKKLNQ